MHLSFYPSNHTIPPIQLSSFLPLSFLSFLFLLLPSFLTPPFHLSTHSTPTHRSIHISFHSSNHPIPSIQLSSYPLRRTSIDTSQVTEMSTLPKNKFAFRAVIVWLPHLAMTLSVPCRVWKHYSVSCLRRADTVPCAVTFHADMYIIHASFHSNQPIQPFIYLFVYSFPFQCSWCGIWASCTTSIG